MGKAHWVDKIFNEVGLTGSLAHLETNLGACQVAQQ